MGSTILHRLAKWSEEIGDKPLFTFLDEHLVEKESLSFAGLLTSASAIAANLENAKLSGKRVALFFNPGLGFIKSFIGCLLAQVIPVPLPPPRGSRQIERVLPSLLDCEVSAIVTDEFALKEATHVFKGKLFPIKEFDFSLSLASKEISANDIAFIQYTSGSTSSPKGCIIRHGNLYFNQQQISKAFSHNQDSVVVGWLPMYHDMGLIGNILHPIFFGISAYLMSPLTFMKNPLSWLEAISRYKATTSGGPNFSFDLCTKKIAESALENLDLSSWEIAFNGSEMIRSSTLVDFSKKFSKCGFKQSTFFPCYGLAEATLFVSSAEKKHGFVVDRQLLKNGHLSEYISCGKIWGDDQVLIIDPTKKKCLPDGAIGEIWIQSKSIASGYWNKPELTQEKFRCKLPGFNGEFLNSGDLGYVKNGELFLVGRKKNMVIIRGKNYYSNDIEKVAADRVNFSGFASNAAFSIPAEGEEQLILVQEIPRTLRSVQDLQQIALEIQRKIGSEIGVFPSDVVLVLSNSLAKTTSGKVRHHIVKEQYLACQLKHVFSFKKNILPTLNKFEGCLKEFPEIFVNYLNSLKGISWRGANQTTRFIDIGVDSLQASEIIHWAEENFEAEIAIDDLLDGMTIGELWNILSKASSIPQKQEAAVQTHTPLEFGISPYQQPLLLHAQLYPQSAAYNVVGKAKILGRFCAKRLQEAVNLLCKLHPMLHAGFQQKKDLTSLKCEPQVDAWIDFYDYSNLEDTTKKQKTDEVLSREIQRIWDFSSPPLFRFCLIKLDATEFFLCVNFHHLICDGLSLNIVFEDLFTIYNNPDKENLWKKFKNSKRSYQEFISQAKLQSVDQTAINFWVNLLENQEFSTLAISNIQESNHSKIGIVIQRSYEVDSMFHRLAKVTDATLAVVIMSLFHAVLAYYSGETSIHVGYPSANRPKGFHQTVGMFVNTLISASRIGHFTTFRELVKSIKQNLWAGEKFSGVPLTVLQEELIKQKSDCPKELFNAFFVMQNFEFKEIETKDFTIKECASVEVEPMYDYICEVQKTQDTIKINFQFSAKKITHEIAEEFVQCFENTAKIALENPDFVLNSAELFTKNESARILHFEKGLTARNASSKSYHSIVEGFKIAVDKYRDCPALIADDMSLTYQELNILSNKIAALLLDRKVNPGDRIGILLPRCIYQCASILAISKMGAVYVPFDVNTPMKRIEMLLKELQLKALITLEDFRQFGDEVENALFFIDPSQDTHNGKEVFTQIEYEDPAYVIFTSGSTGSPKGVLVSHGSLCNFVKEAQEFFALDDQARVLQFSSVNWDTYSEEVFPTLLSGGAVILRSQNPVESFDELFKRSDTFHLTHWNLPSSYFEELMADMENHKRRIPASLKMVIIGGEKVSKQAIERWFRLFPKSTTLLNTYGATEITSISTTAVISPNDLSFSSPPIGKPIGGVVASIRNQYGNRVPIGVEGELIIGGKGLSHGYLEVNKKVEAQGKFISFEGSSEKFYKTGDKAFWTKEGKIILKGRTDRMIKRRGVRIHLEEIEAALNRMTSVANCLVIFQEELMAFVLHPAKKEITFDEQDLKNQLSLVLPSYMVPEKIFFLRDFPRLPNGKIDQQSLKIYAKKTSSCHRNKNLQCTLSKEENLVFQNWEEVLGHGNFSSNDNFFEVGGNSLLLTKLHSALQREFSMQFDISLLFSHYTCRSQSLLFNQESSHQSLTNQHHQKTMLDDILQDLYAGNLSIEEVEIALNKKDK